MTTERMNTLSMPLYIQEVKKAQAMHPEWRYGQALFNVLDEHWPGIEREIRATDLDPFYFEEQQSVRLDRFLDYVRSFHNRTTKVKRGVYRFSHDDGDDA